MSAEEVLNLGEAHLIGEIFSPSIMMYDPDAYIQKPLEDPESKENPGPLFVQNSVHFIKEV